LKSSESIVIPLNKLFMISIPTLAYKKYRIIENNNNMRDVVKKNINNKFIR